MKEAADIAPRSVPFRDQPRLEQAIAGLAEQQHGIVDLDQLRRLGLSSSAVRKRVGDGRLHRIHRGVFAARHPGLGAPGRWMAAVLAYRPMGVLSHRAAAAHLGLRPSARARIDVTVPRGCGRSKWQIDLHRTGTLEPHDVVVHEGIRCTSVARTLVDLGDVVVPRTVERAVEQAEIARVFDLRAVEDALARAGPRRGAGVLRAVLADAGGPAPTRSELEERFLELCRSAALPQPAVNEWLAPDGEDFQVDFLWRRQRLIVETDGRATHATRQAFERDRLRDQKLTLEGYRVVRFSDRQVTKEPDRVAGTIATLLGR